MEKILKDKQLIFSGVQPTGNLHLGNYLGAIKNWVDLQEDKKCIFCIVDLHAITVHENKMKLKENTEMIAAAYIASGIDPKKNIIFVQSCISGHAELAWILGCHTPIGWLNRMTQFKDKAGKNKEKAPLGLYSYPVLMASDILLYKATHVPVGEDQKQHLELSRDIAQAFNRFYSENFFPVPEPMILGDATRVMSLKDGTKKMSKSDPSEHSRINLTDNYDQVIKKIRKAKTDAFPFPDSIEELEERPEIKNLVNIFSSIKKVNAQTLVKNYSGKNLKTFKDDLGEIISSQISKISSEIKKLVDDKKYLHEVLNDGTNRALEIASKNMEQVKKLIEFYKI